MITLILNNKMVTSDISPGEVTLDFIRLKQGLRGTKEGCREGDCGACTVLIGELTTSGMYYRTAASCLLPIGELHGKHLVTIEGLNGKTLSPIQTAITDEGATQCGFCTPGIIMALTGFLLNSQTLSEEDALSAIEGNICRCTGYSSIRRAVHRLTSNLNIAATNIAKRYELLYEAGLLPDLFHNIDKQLKVIPVATNDTKENNNTIIVAGGTDLFVQQADKLRTTNLQFISSELTAPKIKLDDKRIIIDATINVEELKNSSILNENIPQWSDKLQLLSSTMIRNRATLSGNLVNASPIADLAIIFLALDAILIINSGDNFRELPLDQFYNGYKQFDLKKNELIKKVMMQPLISSSHFNFEKVSKRQYLDIASVNSACLINADNGIIISARMSAGGVGPIPHFLKETSAWLTGKEISPATVTKAMNLVGEEISPISDIRGSANYKLRLLQRLVVAHFVECFPELDWKELIDELS